MYDLAFGKRSPTGSFSKVSTAIAVAIFRVHILESCDINYCWPSPT
jgi:hypothetical protein